MKSFERMGGELSGWQGQLGRVPDSTPTGLLQSMERVSIQVNSTMGTGLEEAGTKDKRYKGIGVEGI